MVTVQWSVMVLAPYRDMQAQIPARRSREGTRSTWIEASEHGEDEEQDDGVEETGAGAARQAEVSVFSLKETEQPIVVYTAGRQGVCARMHPPVYHHLRFAALYIMRHAHNLTSSGDRIVYRLPRDINALIVDQLNIFSVHSVQRNRGEGKR